MNRIKIITLILFIGVGSACTPSTQAIQTAIAHTQAANSTSIIAPIQPTNTPYKTPTIFFIASATSRPTIIPLPTPIEYTFVLESGWCLLQVGNIDANVDPKTVKLHNVDGCSLSNRQQIKMILNAYMEMTLWNNDGGVEPYCALFKLDGTFIMSNVDITGSGKVQCGPPQGYHP